MTEYNLSLLAVDAVLLAVVSRRPLAGSIFAMATLLAFGLALATFLMRVGVVGSSFGWLGLVAWLVFAHLPLVMLGSAWLGRCKVPTAARVSLLGGLVVLAVALDAFVIEPRWLEITRIEIDGPGLDAPLRIVVLADIQTDSVGAWEEAVFARAMAERPDMLLMPGDHIQVPSSLPAEYQAQAEAFNSVVRRAVADLPLGAWATQGNTDFDTVWTRLFDGSAVQTMSETATILAGPVALTGLSFNDSFNTSLQITTADRFHVVFGHGPDFALGNIPADLLIAGHTHGGQVRLPFIGPLITLSRIPRAWADTTTRLDDRRTLVVSRGIGMERHEAPRLRFLCRPEMVVIDIVPAPG